MKDVETITIRLSQKWYENVKKAANLAGVKKTKWVRDVVLANTTEGKIVVIYHGILEKQLEIKELKAKLKNVKMFIKEADRLKNDHS